MWETQDPRAWLKQVAEKPETIPNTFAHQASLPRLPVPDLNETLNKYLEVVLPVLTADEFQATKRVVEEFRTGQGQVLQQRLLEHEEQCKNNGVTNWLKDWWLHGAYLSDRVPIPINSNVFAVTRDHPLATIHKINPILRATGILNHTAIYRKLIENGQIPIDHQGKRPLCMDQHRRIYSTVRVPGEQVDHIEVYPLEKSRHSIILIREHFFRIDTIDEKLNVRSCKDILHDLEEIVALANALPAAPPVSCFTYQDRTFWAKARAKLVDHSAGNKETFSTINSAISVAIFDENEPVTNDEVARLSLNGEGCMRYFDKSSQMIFFANGRAGMNGEHTPYDAPPSAQHGLNFCLMMETPEEYFEMSNNHRWDYILPQGRNHPRAGKTWRHLPIDIPPSVQTDLELAIPRAIAFAKSSDIKVLEYEKYGMDFIRNVAHQSPDSWIQMALQVAFFRLTGTCTPVYETQTTRLFRDGRTETGRTLSLDQIKFVRTFQDPKMSPVDKYEALRSAINTHIKYMLEAGQGKGIDRHFLGLRFCRKPDEPMPAIFTDPAWTRCNNFLLSTSNMTPSVYWEGGFGAYLHEGYGCCYGVRPHQIWASISTRTTTAKTSSDVFRRTLAKVFDDMRDMVVAAVAINPKITVNPNIKAQARM